MESVLMSLSVIFWLAFIVSIGWGIAELVIHSLKG